MNRPSHYETKGKQAVLFGNATVGQILLITFLFLLNMAVILCLDNFFIHNIPLDTSGIPALEAYIPGEVLSSRQTGGGYLILYRTDTGEKKVASATGNYLSRYHLDLDAASITEEPYSQKGLLLNFTVEEGQITQGSHISLLSSRAELGALIVLGFLITSLERLLLQKLRGE